MIHGRYSTYTNWACRCDECVEANRVKNAAFRLARMERPMPASVRHGRNSTYTNWACRCEGCTAAHRAAYRQWRKPRTTHVVEGKEGGA